MHYHLCAVYLIMAVRCNVIKSPIGKFVRPSLIQAHPRLPAGVIPDESYGSAFRPFCGDPLRSGRSLAPGRPVPCLYPGWATTHPIVRLPPGFPIASGVADPRYPLPANPTRATSRSSPCHSPSPAAAFPRECRSVERTGSRLMLFDSKCAACRLSVIQVQVVAEVLRSAEVHDSPVVSPCPNHTHTWGFVRRSKDPNYPWDHDHEFR